MSDLIRVGTHSQDVDQVALVLGEGLTIDRIVLNNGWKYHRVSDVRPTEVPGMYFVRYDFNGEPIGTVIAGADVALLEFKEASA